MRSKEVEFSTLVGKTLERIDVQGDEAIRFECADGSEYLMKHTQECCEYVYIEDIDGDIQRLVGQEIVVAEARESSDEPPTEDVDRSYTWTFYVLRTNLDSVTIRWFGTSNGYYSETVSVRLVKPASQ